MNIGDSIEKNYKYLNIKKITDIEELKSFYQRKFPDATEVERNKEMENHFLDKDKTNAFQIWLDAKVEDLIENNIDISDSHYLKNFYYKN